MSKARRRPARPPDRDRFTVVFRNPGRAGYAVVQTVERGGTVAPAALPDAVVVVAEILPPA